jgi:hypothetical protein
MKVQCQTCGEYVEETEVENCPSCAERCPMCGFWPENHDQDRCEGRQFLTLDAQGLREQLRDLQSKLDGAKAEISRLAHECVEKQDEIDEKMWVIRLQTSVLEDVYGAIEHREEFHVLTCKVVAALNPDDYDHPYRSMVRGFENES